LAQYQSTAKDWRFMLTRLDEMKAVTSEMIREVAKNYLTENNRTVATLIPIEESNSNKEAGK
ncbi:MAG: insulinase family protein, partial [candidate division Zixibacteria bacterium]|nr:insulinase family protein [candidate division Zixibacteria bacterium]